MYWYFAILLTLLFIPGAVYGEDLIVTPKSSTVGPNDWIVVDLSLEGYKGGEVTWIAHKPDGTTDSGALSSFQASKKTHSITRNAFDNLFGDWSIEYTYNDVKKTVKITVEPLTLEIIPDKQEYYPGEKMHVKFTTNYYEIISTKAEDFFIEVHDKNGNIAKQTSKIRIKAIDPTMKHEFIVDEIVKYNPFDKYKIRLQYYNTVIEKEIEFKPQGAPTSIFLASEKKVYRTGEFAQLQLILTQVSSPLAKIKVTAPDGSVLSKDVAVDSSLTRILLDNVPLTKRGTYNIEINYSGQTKQASFDVNGESSNAGNELAFSASLNKKSVKPGEIIQIEIKSGRTIGGPLSYWFEGPERQKTPIYLIQYESPGMLLPYVIPKDSLQGPWKFMMQFKDVTLSSIFVVSGSPVETQTQQILKEAYIEPKIIQTSNELVIPDWVKNNAKWWNEGKLPDSDFTAGIKFMMDKKIINIPLLEKSGEETQEKIPDWVKNNAKWWSEGKLSNTDFANGIEFMVKAGIIRV